MEDLFRSYWWLLFPIGWMIYGGFTSWLNYRRQRDAISLIRAYADKGQQPPEALLKLMEKPIDSETEFWKSNGQSDTPRPAQARQYWSLFGLFAVLSLGFGVAMNVNGGLDGGGWPYGVVALTMGAVAIWALINACFLGRTPRP